MSTPSAADFQSLTTMITTLVGQVGGLLARIAELERQPRSGIAGPPTTPKQARGSSRKGKGAAAKPPHPARIATVTSNAVPLTFPLAQDLPKGTSSADRFTMTCVIPDACAGHVIGRQGRGLKQVADISGARVAAFSVKDHGGPSFGQRHITIRGTESQIGAALRVVGKQRARQRVRTPRPKGKGKETRAGEKQQPSTFSIPIHPPAAPAAAFSHPRPSTHQQSALSDAPSVGSPMTTTTTGTMTPVQGPPQYLALPTPASPMSVSNTTPASPMSIGATASSSASRPPEPPHPPQDWWPPPLPRGSMQHGSSGLPRRNYAWRGGGG